MHKGNYKIAECLYSRYYTIFFFWFDWTLEKFYWHYISSQNFNKMIKNRCDNAGENGVTRLANVRCPVGLAFDVQRQTCDWKSNVKNCDQLGSKSILNGRYWHFQHFFNSHMYSAEMITQV